MIWLNIDEGTNDESDNDDNEEEEREVRFSQWISTDRSDIVKQRLPVAEFVDLLVRKLDKLTPHLYIAKTQGEYVKKVRHGLKLGEIVVLGDFAENHGFIIQDKVQSFHWNKKSCTLYPVMIYYTTNDDKVLSRWFLFQMISNMYITLCTNRN